MTQSTEANILELPGRYSADLTASIKDIGSAFFRQGQALERLSQTYDQDAYRKALQLALETKGHLIVIGMGKSGHVGRKISATLASTGTPSFFLHPAEASHGDLGMVTPGDSLFIISYSGETQEIIQLLPSLKAFGNRVIAVTGNKNSTLGRAADVVLDIPVNEEVCPNNLVPTTSILVTTAIGDAFAISLMTLRNFQAHDFARNHPGGSLGRRLLMRVSDVMHTTSVPKVGPDAILLDLATEMAGSPVGIAVVVDEDDRAIGVVTKGQLGVALRVTRRVKEVTARQCMTQDFQTISADVILDKAETKMREQSVSFLIALSGDGRYCGLYARDDA